MAMNIADFLGEVGPRGRKRRSGAGLLVTVLMIPALLGVMGCYDLPAPIGDPEKSRIDPRISGIWLGDSGDNDVLMLIFEPYDKRTWVLKWVTITELFEDDEEEDLDPTVVDELEEGEIEEIIVDGPPDDGDSLEWFRSAPLEVESVVLFKVWRKRISGQSFLTMELKGILEEESGMESGVWWTAQLIAVDDQRLTLKFINPEFEQIEDEMTRSELERVVRRNLDNPDLLDEDFPGTFVKVPQADYGLVSELIETSGLAASY